MNPLTLAFKRWKVLLLAFITLDVLAVGGVMMFMAQSVDAERAIAAEARMTLEAPTPTRTATPTPWPGPGPKPTATATSPPTPLATDVLALSGFPPGFTPTPRPTREQVYISLPYVSPIHSSSVDVPEINQIYYPEPFFPPGTNNACGPVALYAAMLGLGLEVNYTRLRDIAVQYGFTHYGISKSGMVGTLSTLNQELGAPLDIEHGNRYNTSNLIKQIRRGGVAIVLLRITKAGGYWQVTADRSNSIGHFLIVESVNLRKNTVRFAGSTLGMEEVPLTDFVASWSSNPQAVAAPPRPVSGGLVPWRSPNTDTDAVNWAIIARRQ